MRVQVWWIMSMILYPILSNKFLKIFLVDSSQLGIRVGS